MPLTSARSTLVFALFNFAAFLAPGPAPVLAASPVVPLDGFWKDSDGEVILQVLPCGAHRCAHVAWLRQPNGADGKPLLDVKNAVPAKRTQPVCGMRVISGFALKPDGSWGGGTVYVPDHGVSVSGSATILSPNEIKVAGYMLLPIFGSSEVWTRVPPPTPHCAPY